MNPDQYRPGCLMCRIIAIVLLLLRLNRPLSGVTAYEPVASDPLPESWRWQFIPEMYGRHFTMMTEDTLGAMLFGYDGGFARYDGYAWQFHDFTPDMAFKHVTSILQTSEGIYVGTTAGLNLFTSEGVWVNIFKEPSNGGYAVWALTALPRGGVLVSSMAGLYLIKEGRYHIYMPEIFTGVYDTVLTQCAIHDIVPGYGGFKFDVRDVLVDRDHTLWIFFTGSDRINLLKARMTDDPENPLEIWTPPKQERDGLHFGWSTYAVQTPDGRIWVASENARIGLYVWDGRRWHCHDTAAMFGGNNLGSTPVVAPDGALLVGAEGRLLSLRNGRWRAYAKPEIPVSSAARIVLYTDSRGNVWVGGWRNDLYMLEYSDAHWLKYEGLSFQCETETGDCWFLSRDNRVVVHKQKGWLAYDQSDGLIDAPTALLCTSRGHVWAFGSHDGQAATACLVNGRWHRQIHADLMWGIQPRSPFEDSRGDIWFGRAATLWEDNEIPFGVKRLSYDTFENLCFTPVRPSHAEGGIAQDGLGRVHVSEYFGLFRQAAPDTFEKIQKIGKIESLHATPSGRIWYGSRQNGVSVMSEQGVVNYNHNGVFGYRFNPNGTLIEDGTITGHAPRDTRLESNTVISVFAQHDSAVWIATDRDFARFDGRAWTHDLFPRAFLLKGGGGGLRADADGSIWINQVPPEWNRRVYHGKQHQEIASPFFTVRYRPDQEAPDTRIETFSEKVDQSGNTLITWSGVDPWHNSSPDALLFSYRLDRMAWSAYAYRNSVTLTGLSSGRHVFEVRARDKDGNVDPSPARCEFRVAAPVWKQAWFIGLVCLFVVAITIQASRILKRDRQLLKTNHELEHTANALKRSNEDLQQFAYVASHDLQEPLRMVASYMTLLGRRLGDHLDSDSREFMAFAVDGAKRMQVLINDLLQYSRITTQAHPFSPVDCNALLDKVVSALQISIEESGAAILVAPLPEVCGDGMQLFRVFQNLISNAIKYRGEKTPEVRITAHLTGEMVEFAVRDNGIGIDPQFNAHIFGIFKRLHGREEYSGTGIGLAVCKKIVERHGGQIRVESVAGEGSTFYFTLPCKGDGIAVKSTQNANRHRSG